jgi:CubicO group peptidase (beta-lactamase class C family)
MKVLITLCLFVCSFNTYSQDSVESNVYSFEERLKELLAQNNLPSISFAIICNQRLLYSSAMGFADIHKNILATDTTIYSLASITKPIASAIILKLAEKGLIKLDDKMKDHWPEYEAYYASFVKKWKEETPQYLPFIRNYHYNRDDITIRHHLTHTSEGVPGTAYKYNGFLYGGLSIIADHASSKNFKTLIKEEIISKLRMEHSAIDFQSVHDTALKKLLSTPYEEDDDKFHPASYPQPHGLSAAAGFLSCVKDLARFDIAIDLNRIISASSKMEAMTPYRFPDGTTSPYGLGWFITSAKGQTIVYHYGLQESYSGIYLKIPGKNITLIILSNCSLLTKSYHPSMSQGIINTNPYIDVFLKVFL